MKEPSIAGSPSLPRETLPAEIQPIVVSAEPGEPPNLAVVYARTILRRKWTIMGCAALGGLLGFAATLSSPAMYRARTSFDVLGVNEDFMNIRAVDPTEQVGGNSVETLLQTEIKLLESETLLKRVIAKMENEPPDSRVPVRAPLDSVLEIIHLRPRVPESRDAEIRYLAAHMTAKPIGMTRLIEVGCESPDKVLATKFCNTLADEFVKQDQEVRFESARQTISFLQSRLTEVRATLEESEQKLQHFEIENKLLFSDDRESVAQSRLRMLETDTSQAEADRTAREAQLHVGLTADPDSLPVVLDDEPSKQYRIKLAELERQRAEFSTTFTPESPQIVKIDTQIAVLNASIEQARKNMIERLRNEFDAASAREQALAKKYQDEEKVVSGQIAKTSQLHMLEREAESGRQLYAALLQRVKEAGFASALRSAPVRVVDQAGIPVFPSGPRRGLSAGIGLLGGILFGITIAFLQVRTDTSLRLPGDARRSLAVREFGVIPRATASALRNDYRGRRLRHVRGLKWLDPVSSKDKRHPALELITWDRKRSLMAEAYRSAMSSILYSARGADLKSIVVSSPAMGEGKTTVATNLAIAFAEAGLRVLLMDTDLRMPRIHTVFDVGDNIGVQQVLMGNDDLATCPLGLLAQETLVPKLYVLPSGTGSEDPAILLHSGRLPKLLQRLEREFNLVLIDSPPMRHLTDARTTARLTTGMVLVLRAGVATRESATEAARLLREDGIPILGVILNDFNPDKEAIHDYYRDYYRYRGKVPA